ncbi:TPA: hypothetical protein J1413_004864 [Escherichia coli]|nr:hypothetical protein [Escherichia coli]HBA9523024.1 hypothetical protein [Escherichia coli]HBA9550979.1 hypothetical protein [Escherichia coli]HBA9560438.1 hypothetical protein [Escherichia coli]
MEENIDNTEHLLKLLYAPSLYIDSSYLVMLPNKGVTFSHQIINYWIINYFKLENIQRDFFFQKKDNITLSLIRNWFLLPKVAILIGGYLSRNIFSSGFTHPEILKFMSLPLSYQIAPNILTQSNVMANGITFIRELCVTLPSALRQRFYLCFPENIVYPELDVPRTPDNLNLLKVAFSYAKNM